MHPMLNTAIKAARRAGTIINRASLDLERLTVARKGPRDYVTEVDRASEEAIVEVLRTAYPDHAVLGEEFGLQGPEQAEFQWIIDPLDGTTNYIHGLPNYAVSIALLHRRQVTQAVVYDPSRNELFTASRGSGTFLNDRRVRVSGRIRYHDALLGAHWPHSTDPDQGSGRFRAMAEGSASVRRLGSTVLDLAYVACGRLDGFCGVGLKPWDVAAGSLLVLEAGGLLADFDGEQGWLDTGNVLAGTPKVFTHMLTALQPRTA
ncbi:inositol-1-monophosphatase [Bordetella pertussis]|uniref:Inositol-1-monophosphatase n=1 Tax=Bordetella pertussis (strain ATCC 9797 / DSM 5571 / CCUG 30873 / LMG 14455 / NCTC 10739 / 18323) TaxID=568706 RepID=A0A0T7CLH4_BORP1|nr:inositol monophosphatase family protein [Bordetella pertussis]AZR84100.1 inositol monophosphatase [Bordetella pertussis]PNP05153.1 inositol monophosphatase [Bordetella pertussis 18323]UEB59622.1 inositol monophosphatase [Bordetella pertussis]CCJ62326.1 inositol-1-monophosphatase [Bordetella pertussis 18323]CFP46890.1 inositol-1-monophosphatase [Bordetella pertussis]